MLVEWPNDRLSQTILQKDLTFLNDLRRMHILKMSLTQRNFRNPIDFQTLQFVFLNPHQQSIFGSNDQFRTLCKVEKKQICIKLVDLTSQLITFLDTPVWLMEATIFPLLQSLRVFYKGEIDHLFFIPKSHFLFYSLHFSHQIVFLVFFSYFFFIHKQILVLNFKIDFLLSGSIKLNFCITDHDKMRWKKGLKKTNLRRTKSVQLHGKYRRLKKKMVMVRSQYMKMTKNLMKKSMSDMKNNSQTFLIQQIKVVNKNLIIFFINVYVFIEYIILSLNNMNIFHKIVYINRFNSFNLIFKLDQFDQNLSKFIKELYKKQSLYKIISHYLQLSINPMGNKFGPTKNQSINSQSQNTNSFQFQQSYQSNSRSQKNKQEPSIQRLNQKPDDGKKETVAVIVTLLQDWSYDSLFSSVEQKVQEGTKVVVYQCSCHSINLISKAFDGSYKNEILKEMITQINKVDPDCVVFNWECCGHYSNQTIKEGSDNLFMFVKRMIDKKFLCMFSDFSLKALIKNWNSKLLGPNPFKKIGETGEVVQLRFKAGQLKQCPSAQLQTVGQMAEQGKVNVHTQGATIVYTVNKKILKKVEKSQEYNLQILTVVNNMKVDDENLKCHIGEFSGPAGHVLIKYPSGGAILTSMTHWIELMKVDTSQQKLFEVAAREYGANYANLQKMEYDALDQVEKVNWRAQKATEFIQNQAPCSNMVRKARS